MPESNNPSLSSKWRWRLKSGLLRGFVCLFALAVLPPCLPNPYYVHVLVLAQIYVMLGLGLNVVVGFAGLLDLGYVAFYAVGAYTCALLITHYHCSFWYLLPLGGFLAATFGVIIGIPTIRTRGDYLAIVTLGFGEIVRLIIRNWDSVTNGPQGIMDIDRPHAFGFTFAQPIHFYYLILVLCLLTYLAVSELNNSRIGRAWIAIKDDEDAASAMGIDPVRLKLCAFAVGAFFAGTAGVFFASWQSFVAPESFSFFESVIILCMVVIGGMGSIPGTIIAAVVLVLLPELLRSLPVQDYRMLALGIGMVLIMLLRREGLFAPARRLHGATRRALLKEGLITSATLRPADSHFSIAHVTEISRSSEPLLTIKGLIVHFGGLPALDLTQTWEGKPCSDRLEVRSGEILGLIGPNGAGKTTLLNCVTGMVKADEGEVIVGSGVCSLIRLKPHRIAAAGIARTFQNLRLFPSLSILENVMVGLHCRSHVGVWKSLIPFGWKPREEAALARRAMGLLHLVGLEDRCEEKPQKLAYADRKRLELARALATFSTDRNVPRILFLDEPAAGMVESEQTELSQVLRQLQHGQCKDFHCDAIVVIDHSMRFIRQVADRIAVLDHGKWLMPPGPSEEVLNAPTVRVVYLGEADDLVIGSTTITTPSTEVLSVDRLNVWRKGDSHVLCDVTFSVGERELVSIVGANGAGKTTLLTSLCGLMNGIPASEARIKGSIRLMRQNVERRLPEEVARLGIALVPEGRRVFARLSVRENLLMGAYILGSRRSARQERARRFDRVFALFPVLKERAGQAAGTLSGGEQQMLAIGRALMSGPKLLMLDEPSLGLAPTTVRAVFNHIRRLNAEGLTVILVEQNARLALGLAHRAFILESGRIVKEGTGQSLLNDPEVQQAYLGG